jgi:hypothetical protein
MVAFAARLLNAVTPRANVNRTVGNVVDRQVAGAFRDTGCKYPGSHAPTPEAKQQTSLRLQVRTHR